MHTNLTDENSANSETTHCLSLALSQIAHFIMHFRSCGFTMSAACTCPLSPWDRRVSHLSF